MEKMIIQGKIINHDDEFDGSVDINTDTGLIEEVIKNEAEGPERSRGRKGEADIDVGDALIFPGFVDLHVHAREDVSGKDVYKEDYVSASQAAIHGGVVHFVDMPNKPISPVNDDNYNDLLQLAKKSLVDVTLYAGIGPDTHPLSFPVPYKVFMSKGPVGGLFFEDTESLEQT